MVNGALSRWGGEFNIQEGERLLKDPLYLLSPEPQAVVDRINEVQLNEGDNNTSMLSIIPNFSSIGFVRRGNYIPAELDLITAVFILSRLYMLPALPAPFQNRVTKAILSMMTGRGMQSIAHFFTVRPSMTLRGLSHPPVLKDVDGDLLRKIIKYLGTLVDDYVDALVDEGLIENNNIPTLSENVGEEGDVEEEGEEDEEDEEGMPDAAAVAAYMAAVYGSDEENNNQGGGGRGTGGRGRGGRGTGGRGRGGRGTGGRGRGRGGRGTGGRGRGQGGRNESDYDPSEEEDSANEGVDEGWGPNRYVPQQRTPERRSIRRRISS